MDKCFCCEEKIATISPITGLCSKCFKKYKNKTDKYLDSIKDISEFAQMYKEIEAGIEESDVIETQKESLKKAFGEWIYSAAKNVNGVSEEAWKQALNNAVVETQPKESSMAENKKEQSNVVEMKSEASEDSFVKLLSHVERIDNDIHFIKVVVAVYVVLSVICALGALVALL